MKFPFSSANDNKLFCGDMCLRLWGSQQELKSKQICKSGTHTVSAVLSLCCDIHPQWKHKQRAADGCISYRPCLHFLTNKYNLVSPTEMWKYCCAHSGRSAASALPRSPLGTIDFCFTHFAMTETTAAWFWQFHQHQIHYELQRFSRLLLQEHWEWSLLTFAESLGNFQGGDMQCCKKSCGSTSTCESFRRKR